MLQVMQLLLKRVSNCLINLIRKNRNGQKGWNGGKIGMDGKISEWAENRKGRKIGMGGKIGRGGKSEWAELRAEISEWAEFADFWIMVIILHYITLDDGTCEPLLTLYIY